MTDKSKISCSATASVRGRGFGAEGMFEKCAKLRRPVANKKLSHIAFVARKAPTLNNVASRCPKLNAIHGV